MRSSALDQVFSQAPALPEDLARAEAFPAPPPRSVSVATTHASWVFLTDDEAWKVKRPVDFGFLDYSDLEKRRRSCEEEVRLGARLAPDVYRGVVPVFRGPDGFSFVGPGVVVDHAVRMRRLPDAESALAMLRAGRLGAEHLGRLAERLASFYTAAAATPALGASAVLAANVEENHVQTLPYVDRFVGAGALDELYRWQQGALAARETLLSERLAAGRIREGHGDLRLEHVYFPAGDGAPLVIDPIEFNPRFRCQDAALDVAFLAMELEARGRADLAAGFLSRWARESNDYGFYPLLDLYLSYRAWVRAKVACFVADDPATAKETARRKATEAARLFRLARSFTRRRDGCQEVIAVGGMIGAGKSTLADELGRELAIPVVSSDACRKALRGLRPSERGGPELYSEELDRLTFAEMLRHARSVLDSGRGVILDATFRAPHTRALAQALAREHDRRFLFVEVACDEETLRARLRRRAASPSMSDAGEALLAPLQRGYQPPAELAPDERLIVDGRALPARSAAEIGRRLGGGRVAVARVTN
jgi:aminoglycoside phosphotransferase family enzyme/predicted kinase